MCIGRIPLQTIRINGGPVTRNLHIANRSVAVRSGEMCVSEGSLQTIRITVVRVTCTLHSTVYRSMALRGGGEMCVEEGSFYKQLE